MNRLPLRAQLTLLYAVPFFLSAVALLGVPLLATSETQPAPGQGPPGQFAGGDAQADRFLATGGFMLVVMTVVAVALGFLVAGRFLKPLRTITAAARDISATNLHRRLNLPGGNEFAALGATLDDLFARLEASFEAQRRFVANASHELRTPLTAQRALLQVELADPQADVGSLREAARQVLELGVAQQRLIDSLLTLATGERGLAEVEPFDLAELARDAVAARQEEAGRRQVAVRVALAGAPARGDARLVASLVANLVDNALRYNVPGGHVDVATWQAGGRAWLRVANTGPVVAPQAVERLFEPFQRLDGRVRPGDGHGLGLAIVRAIAHAHRARLAVIADPRGGLSVEVSFGPTGPSGAE